MVSRRRDQAAGTSRARLERAAAHEFAARGFDGAKVDRIADRARVNKAMLYYHFGSKSALYRAILRELFGAVADAVEDVRRTGGPPGSQLARFIEAVAVAAIMRPHFPPIWLREIADGGRHLDRSVVGEMRRVLETLGAILKDGRRARVFGDVHPLVTQLGIVAPLLMFAASAPVRERVGHFLPRGLAQIQPEALVRHVQATTIAALGRGARARAGSPGIDAPPQRALRRRARRRGRSRS
jgi:AcrR family transcriptional regulator